MKIRILIPIRKVKLFSDSFYWTPGHSYIVWPGVFFVLFQCKNRVSPFSFPFISEVIYQRIVIFDKTVINNRGYDVLYSYYVIELIFAGSIPYPIFVFIKNNEINSFSNSLYIVFQVILVWNYFAWRLYTILHHTCCKIYICYLISYSSFLTLFCSIESISPLFRTRRLSKRGL